MVTSLTPLQRFSDKIELNEDGCWVWTKATSRGYARFCVDNKHIYAHRWAYEYFVGPIPDGMVLDHLCRNRACVNPAHLEPVTQAENLMRGETTWAHKNKSRTYCVNGHKFDRVNTYVHGNNYRRCRECSKINNLKYSKQKRS